MQNVESYSMWQILSETSWKNDVLDYNSSKYFIDKHCQPHMPRRGRHLNVAYKILKYIKKSPGQGILYSRYSHQIVETYIDAD